MSSALALNQLSSEQIDLIKRTICVGATDDELMLFVQQANRLGLDPFSRQIHAVKRWDAKKQRETMSIQVGIDGFRIVAERSGEYEGQEGPFWCGEDGVWRDVWTSSEPPFAAKAVILRRGCRPFAAVARYRSYVQTAKDGTPNQFWARMPDVMLAKAAESLALRKAFPNDLSGVYAPEEMGSDDLPARAPARDRQPEHKPAAVAYTPPAGGQMIELETLEDLKNYLAEVKLSWANPAVRRRIADYIGRPIHDNAKMNSLTEEEGQIIVGKLREAVKAVREKAADPIAQVKAALEREPGDDDLAEGI